jgi:hypothetical protein
MVAIKVLSAYVDEVLVLARFLLHPLMLLHRSLVHLSKIDRNVEAKVLVGQSVDQMHQIAESNILDLVRSESEARLFLDDLTDRGLAIVLFESQLQQRQGAFIEDN